MLASVIDNVAQRRFELALGEDAIAAAYYRIEQGRVVLIHTEVPEDYAGQGHATRLAIGALELIRESGRKAVLKCPFMGSFLQRHPEFGDVVDG